MPMRASQKVNESFTSSRHSSKDLTLRNSMDQANITDKLRNDTIKVNIPQQKISIPKYRLDCSTNDRIIQKQHNKYNPMNIHEYQGVSKREFTCYGKLKEYQYPQSSDVFSW